VSLKSLVNVRVIIWLFITLYISSLNSYTESDFNIPKDFFKTKYADKDPYSNKNWFNDLVTMSNAVTIKGDNFNTKSWTLDKNINILYFDILWNCIFSKKYKKECEYKKGNYFFNLIYEHDSSIDKKIALIKNNPEKVKKLFNQKYIKLKTINVNNIKEFYSLINIKDINLEIEKLNKQIKEIKNKNINHKYNSYIYDYTKKRSIYRRYKILIDKINEKYKNIKTIANIWKTINDINSNNYNNKQKKDFITKQLNNFYCYSYIYCTISISDFKQYNDDLYYFNNTTKEKIISKSLEKLKISSKNINEKYEKKIMNKWYILWYWEYVWRHKKYLSYNSILELYTSRIYLANTYLEKWNYEKWINILLNNQKFINYLINKSDWPILAYLIFTTLNKVNLSAINYSISNYKLDITSKEKIINTLKEKVELWWFINWIKRDYIKLKKYSIRYINYSLNNNKISTKIYFFIYNNIFYKLFYSPNETKLILKKNFFNILTKNSEFKVNLNINNYIWRDYYNKYYFRQKYKKNDIIKKEKNNQKLRDDLLNQVTKSIKEDKKQILEEDKSLNKIDIKDLWNWFELKQMKDASLLMYKWSTLYLWSHIAKKLPFIWDEWCEKLFTKLNNNIGKQQAWNSLSKNEQKLCMKEYLNKSISVETTNDIRFYIIKKQNYESSSKLLYDVKNKKIIKNY